MTKKIVIGIRRPTYRVNIGDELMLEAVQDALSSFTTEIFEELPPNHSYSCVLDCCGYAYTDTWGNDNIQRLRMLVAQLSLSNTPLMFLPQTFGPFTDVVSIQYMRESLVYAKKVYVRDATSLKHLRQIAPELEDQYALAPDVTTLFHLHKPHRELVPKKTIAVIPNIHMMNVAKQSRYLEWLLSFVYQVRRQGYWPLVIQHDSADEPLMRALPPSTPTLLLPEPKLAKAVVGSCEAVVSSRLHGCLNALTQNIPTFGTSWSFKFTELFSEYNCTDHVFDVNTAASVHIETLQNVLEQGSMPSSTAPATTQAFWQELATLCTTENAAQKSSVVAK